METIENEKVELNKLENNLENNEKDCDEIVIYYNFNCFAIIFFCFICLLFIWCPIAFYGFLYVRSIRRLL